MSAGADESGVQEEQQLQLAPVLDPWTSSIANLRTPFFTVIEWPAERARRHGLSYPTNPHAALAAKIVGMLERPRSSTWLAKRLDFEEHVVIGPPCKLREDGR